MPVNVLPCQFHVMGYNPRFLLCYHLKQTHGYTQVCVSNEDWLS